MVMQSKTADAIRCASDPSAMVGDRVFMAQHMPFLKDNCFSDLTAQRVCNTLCQRASTGRNSTLGGDWDDRLCFTDVAPAMVS